MTTQEAFKVGFLLRCAERGLTPEQSHELVKSAIGPGLGKIIGEMIEAPGRIISSVGPHVMNIGLAGAIGLPIAAGAGTGWALAKATDDDTDVDQAKSDELLAEYQRLADQARRQMAMKQLRGNATVGLPHVPAGASA